MKIVSGSAPAVSINVCDAENIEDRTDQPIGIVVHGGCGPVRASMTPQILEESLAGCRDALMAGFNLLEDGKSAIEAVKAAVVVLEDCPWLNAGKGSVYTATGRHELDAGLMSGEDGRAGGVSCLKRVKNPILAADVVRRETRHCIFSGEGAEVLAAKHGVEFVDSSYFETDYRKAQLEKVLSGSGLGAPVPQLDHAVSVTEVDNPEVQGLPIQPHKDPAVAERRSSSDVTSMTETVGAVALDVNGHLASGSSTGGLTGKLEGRVSDASIPGAGFFADEKVALSATGFGDYFIRRSTCALIADRYRSREGNGSILREDLNSIARRTIHTDMSDCAAGAVAIDVNANISMPFNTVGMFRGYMKKGMSEPYVTVWRK